MKNHTWLDFPSQHFKNLGLNTCSLNILGRRIVFTIEPENLKVTHLSGFKVWGITPDRRDRVVS